MLLAWGGLQERSNNPLGFSIHFSTTKKNSTIAFDCIWLASSVASGIIFRDTEGTIEENKLLLWVIRLTFYLDVEDYVRVLVSKLLTKLLLRDNSSTTHPNIGSVAIVEWHFFVCVVQPTYYWNSFHISQIGTCFYILKFWPVWEHQKDNFFFPNRLSK